MYLPGLVDFGGEEEEEEEDDDDDVADDSSCDTRVVVEKLPILAAGEGLGTARAPSRHAEEEHGGLSDLAAIRCTCPCARDRSFGVLSAQRRALQHDLPPLTIPLTLTC